MSQWVKLGSGGDRHHLFYPQQNRHVGLSEPRFPVFVPEALIQDRLEFLGYGLARSTYEGHQAILAAGPPADARANGKTFLYVAHASAAQSDNCRASSAL